MARIREEVLPGLDADPPLDVVVRGEGFLSLDVENRYD
jgi:hypothetical protein